MAMGRANLALFGEILDNPISPTPETFNWPPISRKIFLAPSNSSVIRELKTQTHKSHVTKWSTLLVSLLWP